MKQLIEFNAYRDDESTEIRFTHDEMNGNHTITNLTNNFRQFLLALGYMEATVNKYVEHSDF